MKNLLFISCILTLTACSNTNENNNSNKNNIYRAAEPIFQGQFIFGPNNIDKGKIPSTDAEEIKAAGVEAVLRILNFPMTLFGDGNGVTILIKNKSDYNYITQKQRDAAKFNYEIRNKNEFWMKGSADKMFSKVFTIIDKGVNNDYLEIKPGDVNFTLGLYKIGSFQND